MRDVNAEVSVVRFAFIPLLCCIFCASSFADSNTSSNKKTAKKVTPRAPASLNGIRDFSCTPGEPGEAVGANFTQVLGGKAYRVISHPTKLGSAYAFEIKTWDRVSAGSFAAGIQGNFNSDWTFQDFNVNSDSKTTTVDKKNADLVPRMVDSLIPYFGKNLRQDSAYRWSPEEARTVADIILKSHKDHCRTYKVCYLMSEAKNNDPQKKVVFNYLPELNERMKVLGDRYLDFEWDASNPITTRYLAPENLVEVSDTAPLVTKDNFLTADAFSNYCQDLDKKDLTPPHGALVQIIDPGGVSAATVASKKNVRRGLDRVDPELLNYIKSENPSGICGIALETVSLKHTQPFANDLDLWSQALQEAKYPLCNNYLHEVLNTEIHTADPQSKDPAVQQVLRYKPIADRLAVDFTHFCATAWEKSDLETILDQARISTVWCRSDHKINLPQRPIAINPCAKK